MSGKPTSLKVGTWGRPGRRLGPATARGRTARFQVGHGTGGRHKSDIDYASNQVVQHTRSAEYGTCSIWTPVSCSSRSVAMCCEPPAPVVP
jgi:hypothetical protein